MKKVFAIALAALMAGSAVAMGGVSVTAQTAFVAGDVDMDGVITGHDAAVVSRYLNVDPDVMTQEQLALADVNGDGVVDGTDADLIHASETVAIGVLGDEEYAVAMDAWVGLEVYATEQTIGVTILDEDVAMTVSEISAAVNNGEAWGVTQVQYNLLDADGDGTVSVKDSLMLLTAYANVQVGNDFYPVDGRYDLNCLADYESGGSNVSASIDEETLEDLGIQ